MPRLSPDRHPEGIPVPTEVVADPGADLEARPTHAPVEPDGGKLYDRLGVTLG